MVKPHTLGFLDLGYESIVDDNLHDAEAKRVHLLMN
jgi:hypothetical protein